MLVVPPMAQTMMACDPPALMDQDTWLSALLTSRPTVSVAGGTLTLTAPGATVTFEDQTESAERRAARGHHLDRRLPRHR